MRKILLLLLVLFSLTSCASRSKLTADETVELALLEREEFLTGFQRDLTDQEKVFIFDYYMRKKENEKSK